MTDNAKNLLQRYNERAVCPNIRRFGKCKKNHKTQKDRFIRGFLRHTVFVEKRLHMAGYTKRLSEGGLSVITTMFGQPKAKMAYRFLTTCLPSLRTSTDTKQAETLCQVWLFLIPRLSKMRIQLKKRATMAVKKNRCEAPYSRGRSWVCICGAGYNGKRFRHCGRHTNVFPAQFL